MNAAFLCGKTGEEDQLTSDIFGLMRYLPPSLVLCPFLDHAKSFLNAELNLNQRMGFVPSEARYFFWPAAHVPATSDGDRALARQPDLLILLADSAGHSAALVTEIKYASFKHNIDARTRREDEDKAVSTGNKPAVTFQGFGESNGDQLADYLRSLERDGVKLRPTGGRSSSTVADLAKECALAQSTLSAVPSDQKFLLYLTGDDFPPLKEIEETRKRFDGRSWPISGSRLFWSGWASLFEVVEKRAAQLSDPRIYQLVLADMLRLLDARDLRRFEGWRGVSIDIPSTTHPYFWNPRWFSNPCRLDASLVERIWFWKERTTPAICKD